jgi:hypothetical protein
MGYLRKIVECGQSDLCHRANVFDTRSGTDLPPVARAEGSSAQAAFWDSTEARRCSTGPNLMAHYEIGLPGCLADLTEYRSQMTDPRPNIARLG